VKAKHVGTHFHLSRNGQESKQNKETQAKEKKYPVL